MPHCFSLQSLTPNRTSSLIGIRPSKHSKRGSKSGSRRGSRCRGERCPDRGRDVSWSMTINIQRFTRPSIGSRGLLLLPRIYPSHDALAIGVDVVGGFAVELNDNFFVIGPFGLFEEDLKDFGIEILLQLVFSIASERRITILISHPFSDSRVRVVTYLADNLSYRIDVDGHLTTTTRSIHDLGNKSHACQSIKYPPSGTKVSSSSSNYAQREDVNPSSRKRTK